MKFETSGLIRSSILSFSWSVKQVVLGNAPIGIRISWDCQFFFVLSISAKHSNFRIFGIVLGLLVRISFIAGHCNSYLIFVDWMDGLFFGAKYLEMGIL